VDLAIPPLVEKLNHRWGIALQVLCLTAPQREALSRYSLSNVEGHSKLLRQLNVLVGDKHY
jgi:hypothetical protein